MNFIKTNWLKLTLAAGSFVFGILMLIPVFMLETFNFIGASQTIGLILFFVGIAAVLGLAACEKTKNIVKYVLLGTGILALTFLSIGMSGLSKTDAQGAIGKSYAYFAKVEDTVAAGEVTLAEKQAELNAKKDELVTAKIEVTGLGLLGLGWEDLVTGYTSGLFGIMTDEAFSDVVNPVSTQIKNIVSDPAVTSEHPQYALVVKLSGIKTQLVSGGFGDLTLQSAPYVIKGIATASSQSLPKLDEAIEQLQGVIDTNKAELAAGKAQVKDANAAAKSIMFLYVCLMIGMGVAPVIIGAKKLICKESKY